MAAHLTLQLDVAFELLEIRTGKHGSKKLYRFEDSEKKMIGTDEAIQLEFEQVLKALSGDEGVRKRKNVERLRDGLAIAGQQVEAALDKFLRL